MSPTDLLSARIVAAADNERRRIAADLHDGLQARLVLLAIRAQALRDGAASTPAVRAEAVALAAGLQAAIDELRELVHGFMPAALTERGLYAAAEELAGWTPIPTTLEVGDDGGALPGSVESSGYFVISEAVANAVKHAHARVRVLARARARGARAVAIRIAHRDGRLRIDVADDGIGGAHLNGGCGLRGIADRVRALDGRLEIVSPPGEGTRIVVELPCGRS